MSTTKPSRDNSLRTEPVTLDDIPQITQLWYNVFSMPEMRALFPDTPGLRQWWDDTNRHDLLHKPGQKYLKVVDENGQMAAYAKWDLAPEERGRRFPPWHADSDRKSCDAFFGGMEKERLRLLGGRKHYCRFLLMFISCTVGTIFLTTPDLDMLGTHPDYRRRGAASMLVAWGCDLADRNGAAAYIDASKEGAVVYERFGFEDRSDPKVRSTGVISMVREPRG